MGKETTEIETCFISAPAGLPLRVLRASLQAHGLRVLIPQELSAGADWASDIKKQISEADLVIGVLTTERPSAGVLFELGQASAFGRRILLIAPPDWDLGPFGLHQFLVLRIDIQNREAIDFALDQVLLAPRPQQRRDLPKRTPLSGLGEKVDPLLSSLDRSLSSNDWQLLEQVVADALRQSGADIVVASPERDIGADLVVWSDVLEPFVGNPLLIEIKARIRGKSDAQRAIQQVASYLGRSGTQWALLLYGDGPPAEDQVWSDGHPTVLVLSVRSLLETLKTRAFPEVVRDLRNDRVHGVRP